MDVVLAIPRPPRVAAVADRVSAARRQLKAAAVGDSVHANPRLRRVAAVVGKAPVIRPQPRTAVENPNVAKVVMIRKGGITLAARIADVATHRFFRLSVVESTLADLAATMDEKTKVCEGTWREHNTRRSVPSLDMNTPD